RLLRLPFRLLAAAGRAREPLLPLSEDLRPGRLLGLGPVAQPARDRTHRSRPLPGVRLASGRLAVRPFLRPAVHGPALADARHEVALLEQAGRPADRLRRAAKRQVRAAALRGPALRQARRPREPGLPAPLHGFPVLPQAAARVERQDPCTAEEPARGGAEPRPDRPQLLARGRPAARDRGEFAP